MNTFIWVWDIVSVVCTLAVVVTVLAAIWYTFRGFVPVLVRLGNGLWRRKVAVFASGDELASLEGLLLECKLFNRKNILKISSPNDIETAENASVFLVHWNSWKDEVDAILDKKTEQTALVLYAPQSQGFITQDVMEKLECRKHTVVNNFRGRLLNDLVTCMITTSYEKK